MAQFKFVEVDFPGQYRKSSIITMSFSLLNMPSFVIDAVEDVKISEVD